MWQLPLDAATRELIDLDDDTVLRELKDAHFRTNLAEFLGHDTWQGISNTPTGMLRDLYPTVYYYGPRATRVEAIANRLLAIYEDNGKHMLKTIPHYNLVTREEGELLVAHTTTAFRPSAHWARDYLGGVSKLIASISVDSDEHLSANEQDIVQYDLKDMLDFELKLDLVPDTKFFTNLKHDHQAYLTAWGLA